MLTEPRLIVGIVLLFGIVLIQVVRLHCRIADLEERGARASALLDRLWEYQCDLQLPKSKRRMKFEGPFIITMPRGSVNARDLS